LLLLFIHQPSTATFELFDKLLLLSSGKMYLSSLVSKVKLYFNSIGFAMPSQTNPVEFVLNLTNMDFNSDVQACQIRTTQIQNSWASSPAALAKTSRIRNVNLGGDSFTYGDSKAFDKRIMTAIWILLH
jgi:hypothetical protein